MIALYIILPLMVLAIVIAVVPVLIGSVRHHRSLQSGRIETVESAAYEAEFWHHMLGHRRGASVATTPDLVSDAEVERVGRSPEDKVEHGGRSSWRTGG
jgi:hypothetical protein